MTDTAPSTVRLRKIGRVLRRFREESGHTLKTAGRLLERSASSLSSIENGVQWLRLRDLGHILDQYNVPADLRAALMTLCEQELQPGWWDAYKDLISHEARDRVSLEHYASRIITTETTFIPGLLQTEDYARAVIRGIAPKQPPTSVERYVEFRLARQRILSDPPSPNLDVILDEAVLRRMRGGRHVMQSQLRRLLNQSELDNVALHVLPFAVDPGNEYAGQFELVDVGAPPILSVGLTEHLIGQWTIEDDAGVLQYRNTFEQTRCLSLSETASRDLINRIISEP